MRLATLFIQLTHSRTRLKAFPHVSVCSAISVKDLDLWLATLRPYCRSSRGGDTFSSAGGSATRPTVDLLEDIGLIKQSLRKNTRRDATRHHNTSPRWHVASGRVLSTRATQSRLAEATFFRSVAGQRPALQSTFQSEITTLTSLLPLFHGHQSGGNRGLGSGRTGVRGRSPSGASRSPGSRECVLYSR
jgi:hypothetical protein